jgi:hypothetical protein
MRENNNNPLIGNVLNEDHKTTVHNQKPKITNFLLIIMNFVILAEQKIKFTFSSNQCHILFLLYLWFTHTTQIWNQF